MIAAAKMGSLGKSLLILLQFNNFLDTKKSVLEASIYNIHLTLNISSCILSIRLKQLTTQFFKFF